MNLLADLVPTADLVREIPELTTAQAERLANFLFQQLLQAGAPVGREDGEITETLAGTALSTVRNQTATVSIRPCTVYRTSAPVTDLLTLTLARTDQSLPLPTIPSFTTALYLETAGPVTVTYRSYIPDTYYERLITALQLIWDDLGAEGLTPTTLNTGLLTGFKADDTAFSYSSRAGVVTKHDYLQSNRAVRYLLQDLCPAFR